MLNLRKANIFKSLLKLYYRSVFAESFKTFIFQKFRRLSCHKVNLQSYVNRPPLCHKVNLPRCEARRRHFILTSDIFGKGQTNILGLCYLFGKTHKQPTVAPLKSIKSTHSTKLLQHALIETDHTISQGRNMVYPGPTDPYFLAVILIPEPLFPQNFDP